MPNFTEQFPTRSSIRRSLLPGALADIINKLGEQSIAEQEKKQKSLEQLGNTLLTLQRSGELGIPVEGPLLPGQERPDITPEVSFEDIARMQEGIIPEQLRRAKVRAPKEKETSGRVRLTNEMVEAFVALRPELNRPVVKKSLSQLVGETMDKKDVLHLLTSPLNKSKLKILEEEMEGIEQEESAPPGEVLVENPSGIPGFIQKSQLGKALKQGYKLRSKGK